MPAAAVIRRIQALSGITGRKACADGLVGLMRNPVAQPPGLYEKPPDSRSVEASGISGVGVTSVDIRRNTNGEGSLLGLT